MKLKLMGNHMVQKLLKFYEPRRPVIVAAGSCVNQINPAHYKLISTVHVPRQSVMFVHIVFLINYASSSQIFSVHGALRHHHSALLWNMLKLRYLRHRRTRYNINNEKYVTLYECQCISNNNNDNNNNNNNNNKTIVIKLHLIEKKHK
jgi:hypothetical protein